MATETNDSTDEMERARLPFGGGDIDLDQALSRSERLRIMVERKALTPLRIIWDDYRARFGFLTLLLYALLGTVGVYVTEAPYVDMAPTNIQWILGKRRFDAILQEPLNPVVWKYPLGTNHLGMDELSLMTHAAPAMYKMMFAGAVLSMFIGVGIATLSGYKGGKVDSVLMTITDTVMGIPGLPLVLILSALLNPENPYIVGLILGIDNWPGLARTLRSQVLALRDEGYVEASRIMGLPTRGIIQRDILPELLPLVFINFTGALVAIIGESVGLYFLGVLPFTHLNWGVALNQAFRQAIGVYGLYNIHQLVLPIFIITWLTFGLTLLSQSLDRVFNPRVRARHSDTVEGEEAPRQQ